MGTLNWAAETSWTFPSDWNFMDLCRPLIPEDRVKVIQQPVGWPGLWIKGVMEKVLGVLAGIKDSSLV
jgi:hypothetical protein